ncbi:RNA recognition motif domain-containing protein [Spirochaetota bacterium]
MSTNIYVGNLPYSLSEDSLRQLFEEYGEVVSSKIISDRNTGRSKGFGFVEMSESSSGDEAIEKLNGTEVDGRNIRVNKARPKREDSY